MNEKKALYADAHKQILAILEGESNRIARMSTVSCILSQVFPDNIWTGFYLVDPDKPDELVVGPYQGTLGCLRVSFGKGVCGVAAVTGQTQIVADVHSFPGHIACDSRSASEIVVPVREKNGALIAVLDIDNALKAAFDKTDQGALEGLVSAVFSK